MRSPLRRGPRPPSHVRPASAASRWLPPIRPRPIIPMRISEPFSSQAREAATSRPIVFKSGIHVFLDVNAQPWPAALGEHVEVAERLRKLDGPKARPVAGNGKVGLGFPGDLEEHAARRARLCRPGRSNGGSADRSRPRSRRAGRPAPRSASRSAPPHALRCARYKRGSRHSLQASARSNSALSSAVASAAPSAAKKLSCPSRRTASGRSSLPVRS